MAYGNGSQEFVWGSELEGHGVMSTFDTIVGISIWMLASLAVVIGIINLCVIKKLTIFHNSFGAFWVSRTIGELGSNIVHVVYSAPTTVFQPKNIPPTFGITIFMIGYFFAAESCIMHQFVSANRMLAVCAPLKYNSMFNRKVTRNCIIFAWTAVSILMSLYILIPCQIIGYSPKYYEYVYIRCDGSDQDSSFIGSIINRGCTAMCTVSLINDCVTFGRIIQIKLTRSKDAQDEHFRRNVRFFAQTAVQNVTMMGTLAIISIVNNRNSGQTGWNIAAFESVILTHVNNGLALILFNPEVRRLFIGKTKSENSTAVEQIAVDQTTIGMVPDDNVQ
ncbi:hypothetical protein QR680_015809 [Steinernema hermaphroditum]|uniref:7TM GPCR serpentine receptor class x (Srx) domain-containing protein n=1 Tax=Steinernema hermaphroditum TaxID=289476 RepID=A0AA39LLI6_9BILA|nr:hypothetical protein QR680_015809 [Steinernema hermaphroditum]